MTTCRYSVAGPVVLVGLVITALATSAIWRLGVVEAWGNIAAGGITAEQPGHWINPTVPYPSGAWTGPPEFLSASRDPSGAVGESHGGLIYFWYVKGLKGVASANPNTFVLASDDWRWRTSYRRADDTIELTATDGRRFRRKGTPEYGVVGVFAPDVDTQALSNLSALSGAILLPDGSTLTLPVADTSWFAERVWIREPSGPSVEVAGVPKYPSSTIGRRWGNGAGGNATISSESIINESTFEITVRGYADDISGRGVFVYPASPPTPDINIKLLGGIASLRDLTVTFGLDSGVTRNAFYQLSAPAGPGLQIPIPPDNPPPVAFRYAILYVPGDTVYLAEAVNDHTGGK